MSKPNHVLVMLMIEFFESERKQRNKRIVDAYTTYSDLLARHYATECKQYRDDVYFAWQTSSMLSIEADNDEINDTLIALRAILKS
jgi:hypothetical protein